MVNFVTENVHIHHKNMKKWKCDPFGDIMLPDISFAFK